MRRYTGFPPGVKDIILARSSGMCEVMVEGFCSYQGAQFHHRRPRGAGGTRQADTNFPSNGLYVCFPCHMYIESNRSEALDAGWLVRQSGCPAAVPVVWRGEPRWMDDEGGFGRVRNVG